MRHPLRPTGLAMLLTTLATVASTAPLLTLAERAQIGPGRSQTWEFEISDELLAQGPALSLLARLDTPTLSGSTFSMRIKLNGAVVGARRLLNKPLETEMLSGQMLSWYGKQSFRVAYSPDYEMANGDDHRACLVDGHAYDFVLEVADLLKPGANALVITHTVKTITRSLVLGQLGLVPAPPRIVKPGDVGTPAPTGPLPTIAPQEPGPVPYKLQMLPHGGFALQGGEERVVLRSSFSYPNVGWNTLGQEVEAGEESAWRPNCTATADGAYRIEAGGASYRLR